MELPSPKAILEAAQWTGEQLRKRPVPMIFVLVCFICCVVLFLLGFLKWETILALTSDSPPPQPGLGIALLVGAAFSFIAAIVAYGLAPIDRNSVHSDTPLSGAIRGLRAFQSGDAELYRRLGRDRLVTELVQAATSDDFRFGILYGRSGSGKTSLVRAGLAPALKDLAAIDIIYWDCGAGATTASLYEAISKQIGIAARPNDLTALFQEIHSLGRRVVVVLDQLESLIYSRGFVESPLLADIRKWIHEVHSVGLVLLLVLRSDTNPLPLIRFLNVRVAPQEIWEITDFTLDEAVAVFVEMMASSGENISPSTARALIIRDATDPSGLISPVDLQLIAWLLKVRPSPIRASQVLTHATTSFSLIYEFTRRVLDGIPSREDRSLAVSVLQALTDNERGVKAAPATLGQLQERLGGGNRLDVLVNHLTSPSVRLVSECYPDGVVSYQLSHDRLISVIPLLMMDEQPRQAKALVTLQTHARAWMVAGRSPRFLLGVVQYLYNRPVLLPLLARNSLEPNSVEFLEATGRSVRVKLYGGVALLCACALVVLIWQSNTGQRLLAERDIAATSPYILSKTQSSWVSLALAAIDKPKQLGQVLRRTDSRPSTAMQWEVELPFWTYTQYAKREATQWITSVKYDSSMKEYGPNCPVRNEDCLAPLFQLDLALWSVTADTALLKHIGELKPVQWQPIISKIGSVLRRAYQQPADPRGVDLTESARTFLEKDPTPISDPKLDWSDLLDGAVSTNDIGLTKLVLTNMEANATKDSVKAIIDVADGHQEVASAAVLSTLAQTLRRLAESTLRTATNDDQRKVATDASEGAESILWGAGDGHNTWLTTIGKVKSSEDRQRIAARWLAVSRPSSSSDWNSFAELCNRQLENDSQVQQNDHTINCLLIMLRAAVKQHEAGGAALALTDIKENMPISADNIRQMADAVVELGDQRLAPLMHDIINSSGSSQTNDSDVTRLYALEGKPEATQNMLVALQKLKSPSVREMESALLEVQTAIGRTKILPEEIQAIRHAHGIPQDCYGRAYYQVLAIGVFNDSHGVVDVMYKDLLDSLISCTLDRESMGLYQRAFQFALRINDDRLLEVFHLTIRRLPIEPNSQFAYIKRLAPHYFDSLAALALQLMDGTGDTRYINELSTVADIDHEPELLREFVWVLAHHNQFRALRLYLTDHVSDVGARAELEAIAICSWSRLNAGRSNPEIDWNTYYTAHQRPID